MILLEPRLTVGPARRVVETLRDAEPALSLVCAKPFGVKASIDRVAAKLIGQHWMFADPAITDRICFFGPSKSAILLMEALIASSDSLAMVGLPLWWSSNE